MLDVSVASSGIYTRATNLLAICFRAKAGGRCLKQLGDCQEVLGFGRSEKRIVLLDFGMDSRLDCVCFYAQQAKLKYYAKLGINSHSLSFFQRLAQVEPQRWPNCRRKLQLIWLECVGYNVLRELCSTEY